MGSGRCTRKTGPPHSVVNPGVKFHSLQINLFICTYFIRPPVVKIAILIDSNLIKMVSILDKNLSFAIDGLYCFCLKEEVGT